MSTEPVTDPEVPVTDPTLEPEPEPDPQALLEVDAACKICRGNGIDLVYKNSTPYEQHLKNVHPNSFD